MALFLTLELDASKLDLIYFQNSVINFDKIIDGYIIRKSILRKKEASPTTWFKVNVPNPKPRPNPQPLNSPKRGKNLNTTDEETS